MDFTIVSLTARDSIHIEQAAAILVSAFAEHHPDAWPDMDSAREEIRDLVDSENILRAAVDKTGRVLGFVGGQPAYDNHTWELHPLAVTPEAQRRGVGSALVRDLEAQLQSRGVICIMLGTDDESNQTSLGGIDLYPDVWEHVARIRNFNQHPFAFYQKMGYVIVGVLPDANGFGKPDIYMSKRIGKLPQS